MSATVTSSCRVRVTLLSAPQRSSIAAGLLVQHLGLDRSLASRLLAREGGVLAESVPVAQAERLGPLLDALGVKVRLDPVGAPDVPAMVELAIQPVRRPSEGTVARVAAHLRRPCPEVREALTDCQGLVLSLCRREAEALRQAFRRDRSLRIVLSNPYAARFDLFLRPERALSPGLSRLLRRLGLSPCPFSGAVGAALDTRTARLVTARHGDIVEALNRDFQRFDLFLAGGGGLARPDLADFLASRARIERARLSAAAGLHNIRLEAGLSRAAARRFHADYATIGLDTRIALACRPSPLND
ncbi:hypothetical protein [Cereibacter sediminicola]|uniref:hypothetical protein n=1 Tax=Cereibacter sediminicola TaxID=2584941 RepID=UPI00119FFFF9|nr:hypothetical protein [Cereibacter sediminicola]